MKRHNLRLMLKQIGYDTTTRAALETIIWVGGVGSSTDVVSTPLFNTLLLARLANDCEMLFPDSTNFNWQSDIWSYQP